MKLRFSPYLLEFKHPFTIAAGSRNSTPIVITELEHEGVIGYGESSMPPYLGESHESVIRFLTKAEKILALYKDPFEKGIILQQVDAIEKGNTAAKAAIDIALHDLTGKLQNKPCYTFWNADRSKTPFSFFTIGMDSEEMIRQKVTEGEQFHFLKIKLSGENDKSIIETIRSVSNKPIAVDVNQGWKDKHQALDMMEWLAEKNTLFVEQPLAKEKVDDMAWLTERSPLPTIADESVQRLTDLEKIKNVFSGINIKLMKCTGMHEASKMILRARELDLKILIGCMSETSCAIAAASHLSPLVDWADLDGAELIKNDLFRGTALINGKMMPSDLPGIGVEKIGKN